MLILCEQRKQENVKILTPKTKTKTKKKGLSTGWNTNGDTSVGIGNVYWCFVDSSLWGSANTADFSMIYAPTTDVDVPGWWSIRMWYYDQGTQLWNLWGNPENYTIADANSGELSTQLSVDVSLVFGISGVSGWETTCDSIASGDQESATVVFDSNFDFYSATAQNRMTDLCTELSYIDDRVMYRSTEQNPCFFRNFSDYVRTQSGSWPQTNKVTLNNLLISFMQDGNYASKFSKWIGTSSATGFATNSTVTWVKQVCIFVFLSFCRILLKLAKKKKKIV